MLKNHSISHKPLAINGNCILYQDNQADKEWVPDDAGHFAFEGENRIFLHSHKPHNPQDNLFRGCSKKHISPLRGAIQKNLAVTASIQ
jgi:hypothetical protein